jgi:sugar phosphate permease
MQKIPLLLLFVGHVWVDASQAILPVALVKLKELFFLNYFQVGFIMAVLNLTSSVIQPVFGSISDRFSTGWFVPVGILWTAFAMGLLGWSANYHVAVLLVGLAGLGTAAFRQSRVCPRPCDWKFFGTRFRASRYAWVAGTGSASVFDHLLLQWRLFKA